MSFDATNIFYFIDAFNGIFHHGYDYQREMLDNIIQNLSGEPLTPMSNSTKCKNNFGHSVMVQMPTGTGKTYVMASVVKWFLENHDQGEVWIVAHRRELVGK